MIQRVQSIWLFLAGLTLFLLLILPIVSFHGTGTEQVFQAGGLYQKNGAAVQQTAAYPALFGGFLFAGITGLLSIFLFRNRQLQQRVIILCILLTLAFTALSAFYIMGVSAAAGSPAVQIGAALPLLSVIFCVLAISGIRRDEALIRSADRLR